MEGEVKDVRDWRWRLTDVSVGREGSLVRAETSEESDSLMTTRAVPATYESKVCHNKEYKRLQVVDS
jgi:hypothetical protein